MGWWAFVAIVCFSNGNCITAESDIRMERFDTCMSMAQNNALQVLSDVVRDESPANGQVASMTAGCRRENG